MGLLAEIQNDALSDTTPVATMLRKMLVLASKVESELLESWVQHELKGYPKDVDLPEYRLLQMNFRYTASNGAYSYENAPLAVWRVVVATGVKDINFLKFRDAIGTIDLTDLKASQNLSVDMMNYSHFLRGKVIEPSYAVHAFWGVLAVSEVIGVVEAVRNRILEFVLALQKTYPDAGEIDGLSTSKTEVIQAVTNIYYNTIHGNVGVAGDANNSTINITVNHGSLLDLRGELTKHGIDQADIIDLEAALAEEPKIEADKRFGPKVGKWVGDMTVKAATGAWGVGLQAGGALLQAALLGYYGLSS